MKKILMAAGLLMCASTANAANPLGISFASNGLGSLVEIGGPFLNPVLRPILSLTSPPASVFIATFVPVGTTVITALGARPASVLYNMAGRVPLPLPGLE